MALTQTEPKKIYLGQTEVKKVYLGSTQVRPSSGPVYDTESIVYKMKADSNGQLYAPICSFARNSGAYYNRNISIDDGAVTNYNGSVNSGGVGELTIATGLIPDSEHVIKITPVSTIYGRAKAFQFVSSHQNLLTEILYDGSYVGYAYSPTDTGDDFRSYQYYYCTNLINAYPENIPDTVTTIGNNFMAYQYYHCTSLTSAATEDFSSSCTTLGYSFRDYQYNACTSLVTIGSEAFNNLITNIPGGFRRAQYRGCDKISGTFSENMSSSVTTIGTEFRAQQFMMNDSYNHSLTSYIENLPSSVSSIGSNYRAGQYYNCRNLTSLTMVATSANVSYKRDVCCIGVGYESPVTVKIIGSVVESGLSSNSAGLSNSLVDEVQVDSSLVSSYQQSSDWSVIDDSKFTSI